MASKESSNEGSMGVRQEQFTRIHIGMTVYVHYMDGILYRGKVLKSRVVRGDRAHHIHYYGFKKKEDEWVDEGDIIPVYLDIEIGDRVYAAWLGDDELQHMWFPGSVVDFTITKSGVKNYRGSRTYHVRYEDGDEDTKLEEQLVVPFKVRQ
jgi:hypothetical protein